MIRRTMAMKLGLFALEPAPEDVEAAVTAVGREIAKQGGSPFELGRRDYDAWSCFVIEDADGSSADDWCQALTMTTGGVGVSVVLFEGAWKLDVFHAGDHIASYDPWPVPGPVLIGDLVEAGRLLDVAPKVFESYCVSPIADLSEDDLDDDDVVEGRFDKYAGYRAYEGDRFEPWDEWGFCDLLHKIGLDYPDPDDRTKVAVALDTPAEGVPWADLPPRLDEDDAVFTATRPPRVNKAWWKP